MSKLLIHETYRYITGCKMVERFIGTEKEQLVVARITAAEIWLGALEFENVL